MSERPNADQIEGWNEGVGKTWVRFQAQLDQQLEPLGGAVMRALDLRPGERVLDVGCGAGASTLALAQAVGPTGVALGIDISRLLLDVARERAGAAGSAARFLEADAQTHPFEAASFDALYSRFGVMFFDDPVAAFANLFRAARPGGRLAFVCWRTGRENPWITLPLEATADLVAALPPPAPEAPGPASFADVERVRRVLGEAGWRDIAAEALDLAIGGSDADETARLMTRVGPLGAALRESGAERALVDRAEAAVKAAIAPYTTAAGVFIPAATWLITATR